MANQKVHPGILALRRAIRATRWDNQGGYPFAGGHCSIGLNADDMAAVLELVGMEMDEIDTTGECADCAFAEDGKERGYAFPCSGCLRPYHDNFIQATPYRLRVIGNAFNQNHYPLESLKELHERWHKAFTPKKAPRIRHPQPSVGKVTD